MTPIRTLIAAIALAALTTTAPAAPTGFTYQGELKLEGDVYSGSADFRVELYSGATLLELRTYTDVEVTFGVFELDLDFDNVHFDGQPLELAISVRTSGSGSYTTLSPNQEIKVAPYSYHADTADNATNANTADTLNTPAAIYSSDDAPTVTIGHTLTDDHAALRVTKGSTNGALDGFNQRIMETESVAAPIGILATADRFPIAGIVNQFNSSSLPSYAIYGQVATDAPSDSAALLAQNLQTGTSAILGYQDLAAQFNGNARVTGNLEKSYAPSTYDLATPIAYANIEFTGTIYSGTPNLTCVWNASLMRYEIEIDNEDYYFTDYVTVVTSAGAANIASTTSFGGRLLVFFRDPVTGVREQNDFHVVVYKPTGAPILRGQQPKTLTPLTSPITDHDLQRRAPLPPREPITASDTSSNLLQRDEPTHP